ncbi:MULTISPECIES: TIGR03618 family F420-dependent PPOX class oxidoreductase [Catenuloplanes]|uniref:PPOX class probable F420-dependent enzyme n=1 Tax=Catenuloplanes niger TaxID=587534 RepID=A0AAE4CYU4_9ACTN|nr:TIGR03618 family F420-dependent PPOX class oxidoreductase [Catenuloplanes niger]MDR7326249.1 PPOX class probable F420-dependent enzyme [Catenuloplanes niger]
MSSVQRRRGPADIGDEFREFWTERHLCTLTTLRPNGTPHVTPVGAVINWAAGTALVLTSATSTKARNAAATGTVALCSVDGRRWSTVEGRARVRTEPDFVADAERRYAERYRVPRVNPNRVILEITLTRVLGNVR